MRSAKEEILKFLDCGYIIASIVKEDKNGEWPAGTIVYTVKHHGQGIITEAIHPFKMWDLIFTHLEKLSIYSDFCNKILECMTGDDNDTINKTLLHWTEDKLGYTLPK